MTSSGIRSGDLRTRPMTTSAAIGQLDVRGDPADDLIAATSLAHDIPLMTRDKRLRRSKRVPIAR